MKRTEPDARGAIAFTESDPRIGELLQRTRRIMDLSLIASLASWDQQTAMPSGASEARMYQMASIRSVIHEQASAPRIGELLYELSSIVAQAPFTDADRGLVRQMQRAYHWETKLPAELVEEVESVRVASVDVWIRARRHSDFASFAPWLERTVVLQREIADRIGYSETRYDALLDAFEPEMTAKRVAELFTPIRDISITMLKRIQASGNTIDTSCLYGTFPLEQQKTLSERLLSTIGYDFQRGQVARSAHPMTCSFGSPVDVRLTLRYNERCLVQALMTALHEGGHALYEQGNAYNIMRTPVVGNMVSIPVIGGASLGAHESQSRLWENALGRSLPFWQGGKFAIIQQSFPEQFKNVDVIDFVRALNKVEPGLIRTEADEVTYNLHIILRFELEKALINGEISVEALPDLWNAKYREYLGIEPANDAEGVLQDIHWPFAYFGYFPTYTLGNLYGAQILHTLYKTFPDFDERLAAGDTNFVLQWLCEHMYAFGGIYRSQDLLKRMTGEAADPQYFVRYLTNKFESIYHLAAQ
ncbi:MAG: carboxypeptidase M32 [Chloroflexi bacterium]|nr:MAG: carboxypeptidase M32 [Chloroflexota bacterium]